MVETQQQRRIEQGNTIHGVFFKPPPHAVERADEPGPDIGTRYDGFFAIVPLSGGK
jgi:hypothetical protein